MNRASDYQEGSSLIPHYPSDMQYVQNSIERMQRKDSVMNLRDGKYSRKSSLEIIKRGDSGILVDEKIADDPMSKQNNSRASGQSRGKNYSR